MKKNLFEMLLIFLIFAALAFASADGRANSEAALRHPGQVLTQLKAGTTLSQLLNGK